MEAFLGLLFLGGIIFVVFIWPSLEYNKDKQRQLHDKRIARLHRDQQAEGVKRAERIARTQAAAATDVAAVHRRTTTVPGLTTAKKQQLLAKWEHACAYCATPFAGADLHWEHITPISVGGANHADNIVPSCATCNLSKGTLTAPAYVKKLGARARPEAKGLRGVRAKVKVGVADRYEAVRAASYAKLNGSEHTRTKASTVLESLTESGELRDVVLKHAELLGARQALRDIVGAWQPRTIGDVKPKSNDWYHKKHRLDCKGQSCKRCRYIYLDPRIKWTLQHVAQTEAHLDLDPRTRILLVLEGRRSKLIPIWVGKRWAPNRTRQADTEWYWFKDPQDHIEYNASRPPDPWYPERDIRQAS